MELKLTDPRNDRSRAHSLHSRRSTGQTGGRWCGRDEQRTVVKRNSYAPFGETFAPTVIDGAGYTGHVMDMATGLTYMQQRYYDPQIGKFLSVDPESVNTESGVHFNRYGYAEGNPYKFTDPDGRCAMLCTAAAGAVVGGLIGGGIELASQIASRKFDGNALLVESGKGAFVGGVIGLTGNIATGNAALSLAAKTGVVAFASGMSGSTAHVVGEIAKGNGVPSLKQTALVGAATALGGAAGSRLAPGVASLTTTSIPKYSAYPIVANGSGNIHFMINIPAQTIQRPITAEVMTNIAESVISEPMVKAASKQ